MVLETLVTLAVSPLQARIEAIVTVVASTLLMIGVPVYVVRRIRAARRAWEESPPWGDLLDRAIASAGERAVEAPLAAFRFHTYKSVCFVYVIQIEHTPEMPIPIALAYLKELHLLNLRENRFPEVIVQLLSTCNYHAQSRRLRTAAAAWHVAETTQTVGDSCTELPAEIHPGERGERG